MEIIGAKKLEDFMGKFNQSRTVMANWRLLVERATWASFHDVKETCPSADNVRNFVVFDIRGNKYRVVAEVDYTKGRLRIRHVLTHDEYISWSASIR